MTTKAEARKRAAAVREGLSPEYMKEASKVISRKVLSLRRFKECGSLFIYVSVAGEPDTEEIIRAAIDAGKRVFVPRCTGPGFMEAAEIADFDRDLAPGKYGIPEPAGGEVILPEDINFAVIPCVAAAFDGRRLGHGAGFYDRYLEKTKCPAAVLCFSPLVTEDIPTESFDVKADMVITDAE